MTRRSGRPGFDGLRRFRTAREGAIAVEFALISSVLLTLFAVSLDMSHLFYANRDAERASTMLLHTLTSCPAKTTTNTALAWRGTDCVTQTMTFLGARMPNILVNFPDAVVSMASVRRVNGAIRMCPGNMTTSALAVLKDDDAGGAVSLTIADKPMLPDLYKTDKTADLKPDATGTGVPFQQYSVDVRGNGDAYACARPE